MTGTLPDVFTGPVSDTGAAFGGPATPLRAQTSAWRSPTATRFDGRPANDFLARAEALVPMRIYRAVVAPAGPSDAGWTTFLVGAVIAGLLGGLVGGLMSF